MPLIIENLFSFNFSFIFSQKIKKKKDELFISPLRRLRSIIYCKCKDYLFVNSLFVTVFFYVSFDVFDNSGYIPFSFLNAALPRPSHKLYIEMHDPNLSVYLNCMLHTNRFDNTRIMLRLGSYLCR